MLPKSFISFNIIIMKNEITVIILIFEEEFDTICKCLSSIKNFKIIIIDNANDIYRKKKS